MQIHTVPPCTLPQRECLTVRGMNDGGIEQTGSGSVAISGGWSGPAFVTILAFAVYLSTLAPDFTFGDSGEFVAASVTLGIPHPPGYPLYVTLGKLFSELPLPGGMGWRLNVMSALAGAVAAGLLARLLMEFLTSASPMLAQRTRWWIASASGLAFAFTRTFWSQAVIAEVYTLHIALLVAALLLTERWSQRGEVRYLRAAMFLLGLDFVAHYSSVLVWPVVAWRVVMGPRCGQGWRSWPMGEYFRLPGLALLGFSLTLFLWIRSYGAPVVDWIPIRSPQDLLSHLFSGGGGFSAHHYAALGWVLRTHLAQVVTDVTPFALLPALIGLAYLRQSDSTAYGLAVSGLCIAGVLVVIPLVFILLPNQRQDIPNFTLPYLPFFFMAVAAGLGAIAQWWVRMRTSYGSGNAKPWWRRVDALALCVVPLIPLTANFSWCDRNGDVVARYYGETILESLPEGAAVAPIEDASCYPLYVLHVVERRRPDIELWPVLPGSARSAASLLDPMAYPPGVVGRRLFTDLTTTTWSVGERMRPGCPVHELMVGELPSSDLSPIPLENIDLICTPIRTYLARDRAGDPNHWGRRVFGGLYTTQGLFLARAGRSEEAEPYFEAALDVDPNQGDALQRLADSAVDNKRLGDAEGYLKRLFAIDPLIPEALVTRGRLALANDDVQAALTDWEMARRIDPANIRSRLLLARAYEAQGDLAEARACMREMRRIETPD